MAYNWIGIILLLLAMNAFGVVFILDDDKKGWAVLTAMLASLFFMLGIGCLLMEGKKQASKECIEGGCPFEQRIEYRKNEDGKKEPVDTTYELRGTN